MPVISSSPLIGAKCTLQICLSAFSGIKYTMKFFWPRQNCKSYLIAHCFSAIYLKCLAAKHHCSWLSFNMRDNTPELSYLLRLHFSTLSNLCLEYPVCLHIGKLEQDLVKNLRVQTVPGKGDLFAALITNDFLFLYFGNTKVSGFSVSQTQPLCMGTHQEKELFQHWSVKPHLCWSQRRFSNWPHATCTD